VRVTVGAISTTIVSVLPVFLLGGLAVQVGAELDFSPAGLGAAVAIYFGVSALTSVPAGALVERYGPAIAARVAISLSVVCLLAIALTARSYPVLVVLLAASAAANGLGQLASNASLTRVSPRRQGLSFGIKQAAIPTATLLAGASVPAIALTLGWRWAFAIAAAAAAGTLALVPPDGGPRRRVPQRPAGVRAANPASLASLYHSDALGALVVIGAAVALGAASAGSLGTFLVDSSVSRGLAPGLAGLTLTLGSLACLAARVGGGWLVDRRGAHGDVTTVAVLLAVGSVGLALLAVPGTVALAAGVLLGFGFGWAFPGLVNVAVVQLHPHAPAAATSITQTGVYLGGCAGPLAFGTVAAARGYPTAWLGAAVAMLVAACLILLGRYLLRAHRTRLVAALPEWRDGDPGGPRR
jgi:MFS family permease